jgi:hypothetical protein
VRLWGLLVLTLVIGPVSATSADSSKPPLAVGAQAPDLQLGDQHGGTFRLSEALAQRDFVVVAFYVKAFTGG